MIEIANGETDKTSAFKDIDKELDDLTQVINDLEVQTLLSGEYDERDALYHHQVRGWRSRGS